VAANFAEANFAEVGHTSQQLALAATRTLTNAVLFFTANILCADSVATVQLVRANVLCADGDGSRLCSWCAPTFYAPMV
jgi:hypothetical protein